MRFRAQAGVAVQEPAIGIRRYTKPRVWTGVELIFSVATFRAYPHLLDYPYCKAAFDRRSLEIQLRFLPEKFGDKARKVVITRLNGRIATAKISVSWLFPNHAKKPTSERWTGARYWYTIDPLDEGPNPTLFGAELVTASTSKKQGYGARLNLSLETIASQIAAAEGISINVLVSRAVEDYLANNYTGLYYKEEEERYDEARREFEEAEE